MLENRAFDHLLGYLKTKNGQINGCLPDQAECSNPIDPLTPNSTLVFVNNRAVYEQVSPSHSLYGTTNQVYGFKGDENDAGVPNMQGFIASYAKQFNESSEGSTIMECFAPAHIPAIAQLAMEYALFDGYFASVPGPTMVNRAYAYSATSHGMGTNDVEMILKGMPQQSMFSQLLDMGLDYRVYFDQVPATLMLKDMRRRAVRDKYRWLDNFYDDVAAGNLSEYSLIEPVYYETATKAGNDMHPDHDVSEGDKLIKKIYDALRAGPKWESTALIITFDEHGGFFDHVPPPTNIPNPDGLNSTNPSFDFTREGVRVPMIVISPYTTKGTVVHAAPAGTGQYEHSSIISTVVHKLFAPDKLHASPTYLTNRDAWAKSFEFLFTMEAEPRTDCPIVATTPTSHREQFPDTLPPLDGQMKLSEFQVELIVTLAGASDDDSISLSDVENSWTEEMGAAYCSERMAFFLKEV